MKVGLASYYVRGSDGTDQDRQNRVELSRRVVEDVVELLRERGAEIIANGEVAERVGCNECGLEDMEEADLVVTVGGDGTVLRTIGAMHDPTPLLGVNTGRVGFLAAVDPEEAVESVDNALNGFDTERRERMVVEVNGEFVGYALNETVVVTSRPAKIMEFDVYRGNELVESVRSDGLVVATPTGSTAYSLSAGGPLVDPSVSVYLVVPLSPFQRRASTWVLPMDASVSVEPTRVEKSANVVLDGAVESVLGKGDTARFTRAENPALFVRTDESFYERVRKTM